MERLRRQLRANPEWGYTDASPWSAVFMAATKDHEFWSRELCTPATLFLARHKRDHQRKDHEEGEASPSKKTRTGARASRRGYTGEDHSEKDPDGTYVKNRRGIEVCRNFNLGRCGTSKAAQSKCKAKRSHQCNKCLGPHQALACPGPWQGRRGELTQEAQGRRGCWHEPRFCHRSAASKAPKISVSTPDTTAEGDHRGELGHQDSQAETHGSHDKGQDGERGGQETR